MGAGEREQGDRIWISPSLNAEGTGTRVFKFDKKSLETFIKVQLELHYTKGDT